jgi:hypothetical protein
METSGTWTQKVFKKMIENNNKIIASEELMGLTSRNVWKELNAKTERI